MIPLAVSITLALAYAVIYYVAPRTLLERLARRNPDVLFYRETSRKLVALTIDDGPHTPLTERILDVLRKHDARATFFVLGARVPENGAVLDRAVAERHELGSHGMSLVPAVLLGAQKLRRDLRETHARLAPRGPVKWFRPGSGWFSRKVLQVANELGYRCALGSIYPHDPHVRSSRINAWYVLSRVRPGDVIILHDGKGRDHVVPALERILTELGRRGYTVCTLSELVARTSRD